MTLLFMSKVMKSHVKVEKPGKMHGKGAKRRFKKSELIQKVVFWINTSLISKHSKPTTCTPCNQSWFPLFSLALISVAISSDLTPTSMLYFSRPWKHETQNRYRISWRLLRIDIMQNCDVKKAWVPTIIMEEEESLTDKLQLQCWFQPTARCSQGRNPQLLECCWSWHSQSAQLKWNCPQSWSPHYRSRSLVENDGQLQLHRV